MNDQQRISGGPSVPHSGARGAERAFAHGRRRTAALTLGALGVVFGDIGTSPLYAMRETVRATGGSAPDRLSVLAAASMIVWSLIIVVTVKYVVLIMRADNEGEDPRTE